MHGNTVYSRRMNKTEQVFYLATSLPGRAAQPISGCGTEKWRREAPVEWPGPGPPGPGPRRRCLVRQKDQSWMNLHIRPPPVKAKQGDTGGFGSSAPDVI